MFTGLILELGQVVGLDKKTDYARLTLSANEIAKEAALGDSIAVNGVCLTVVDISKNMLSFDVSSTTLANTNIGELRVRDKVNLEPSLRANSKMGGHMVSGHVEAVGHIKTRTKKGNAEEVVIKSPDEILKYLVPKGSIAIDGISLTVVDVYHDSFSVVIIPHTARLTTIGFKPVGASVNLEPDMIAKYIYKFVAVYQGLGKKEGNDLLFVNTLKKSGFL